LYRSKQGLDRGIVETLLASVQAASGEFSPKNDDLQRIVTAGLNDSGFLEQVVRTCIGLPPEAKLKALAATAGIRPYALLLAGRILAAPFTAAQRRIQVLGFVPPRASSDSPGRCPVCDSPPAFASLEATEGRRILHCSVCRQTWPFPRLLCPACRNSDQSRLAMITLDENASRWIELCHVCHRYVKTVDQRRLAEAGSLSPAVEEVASLFLDVIAEDEKLVRTVL